MIIVRRVCFKMSLLIRINMALSLKLHERHPERAAPRANGVEDLLASLAAELEVEADRRTFAGRCRLQIK